MNHESTDMKTKKKKKNTEHTEKKSPFSLFPVSFSVFSASYFALSVVYL